MGARGRPGEGFAIPPGPGLPPFLQAAYWVYRPIPFLERCRRRYGDCFTVRFPMNPPYVFASDPEVVREVFAGDPDRLEAGRANVILKPLLGPGSILLLDGKRHRRHRRLLMPPFHGDRMRRYGEVMREVAARRIEGWSPGARVRMQEEFQAVTVEIILRTVFGLGTRERHSRLREALIELLGRTARSTALFLVGRSGNIAFERFQKAIGPLSPLAGFRRSQARVDRLLAEELVERRQSPARGEDVLSMLLDARDEEGRPLDDGELRDELLTLLVAGHETTATALSWVVSRLLAHADVERRVRDELDEAGGEGFDVETLARLAYTDAVIKETMRLDPVLPLVVRQLSEPLALGKLRLPAGVVVAPNVWLTHRREDLWDEPERFRPERFLERSPRPFHFFPFGGGARTCLGMAFARFEILVVLRELLRRTRLRAVPGYRTRVSRRGISLAPSGGMPALVERRDA